MVMTLITVVMTGYHDKSGDVYDDIVGAGKGKDNLMMVLILMGKVGDNDNGGGSGCDFSDGGSVRNVSDTEVDHDAYDNLIGADSSESS